MNEGDEQLRHNGNDASRDARTIRKWLVQRLADLLERDPAEIDLDTPFSAFGLASIQAVVLTGELEDLLGRTLSPTLAWDYPTISQLTDHLARDTGTADLRSGDVTETPEYLEPIAVIGIGCRFPGARDPEAFWQLLCEGVDAVREIPPDRWDAEAYYDPTPGTRGKSCSKWGGFLDDIDLFDPAFFGISPREAAYMDPQQRILLEVSWHALEDAGIPPDALQGTRTGVFIGITGNDYGRVQMDPTRTALYMPTGNAISIAANRLSYFYNLNGPSLVVDTACSSSLVAVHLACRSLWNREAELALVGGTNLILSPTLTVNLSLAGMLSKDGRCKAFDAGANGFVRGEGVGLAVLKPLARAIRDGNRIHALVLGTAINSDGRSNGLTAPSRVAQERALATALRRAGVAPAEVHYAEAHGTGTPLGDPMEAAALAEVLGAGRDQDRTCLLGSVKTNIGHLEGAAGIAGFVKACLCVKHKRVPPSLHFAAPNPNIPFDRIPLRVATSLTPIASNERTVAIVNSFGFGGTNACAVLAEPPPEEAREEVEAVSGPHLLVISAHSEDNLPRVANEWAAYLESEELAATALRELCGSAARHRKHFPWRAAVVGRGRAEMAARLRSIANVGTVSAKPAGEAEAEAGGRLAFVFSGQGSQWAGMGRGLLDGEPAFREAVEEVDAIFAPLASWSLIDQLYRSPDDSGLHDTEYAQPTLFALQLGLSALWRSWGIVPDAIVGHSMGEVAAAQVAGALSLEDAVRVIYHRSRLMRRTAGTGRMVSVRLSCDEIAPRVIRFDGRLAVAGVNAPTATVVSGENGAMDRFLEDLSHDRIAFQPLAVNHAFHSHLMDPILDELVDALGSIQTLDPQIPVYSTVTGRLGDGLHFGPEYWARNLRQPVLLQPAIDCMITDGFCAYVELAPHPTLLGPVRQCLKARDTAGIVVSSLHRDREDEVVVREALGALYVKRLPITWEKVYPGPLRVVSGPRYPWQRQRHWLEYVERELWSRSGSGTVRRDHPFQPRKIDAAHPTWEFQIDLSTLPFLKDHRIQQAIILPAAAYIEMALLAGREILGHDAVELTDIVLHRPLVLGNDPLRLQVVFAEHAGKEGSFEIHARSESDDGAPAPWLLHAEGRATTCPETTDGEPRPNLDELRSRLGERVERPSFYTRLRARGYDYGPAFQGIEMIQRLGSEAVGQLRVSRGPDAAQTSYCIHPAQLDAVLQMTAAALADETTEQARPMLYLPARFGRIRINRTVLQPAWAYASIRPRLDGNPVVVSDLVAYDGEGIVVAEIEGLRLQPAGPAAGAVAKPKERELADLLYELVWEPKPHAGVETRAFLPPIGMLMSELDAESQRQRRLQGLTRTESGVPKIDALAAAYIINALRRLGWSYAVGGQFTLEDTCCALGIVPANRPLVRRYFTILTEEGYFLEAGGTWSVVREFSPADSEALHRSILAQFPALSAELMLMRSTATHLHEILRGACDPLECLFPDGSLTQAERLYEESPFCRASNGLVRCAISRLLEESPRGTVLRILEIGAGTGGLTSALLPILPPDRARYTYTDTSPLFLRHGERKFHAYRGFTEYRLLDIETDPATQGFELPHSFDVVVAGNVLHATADLRSTLGHIRNLLAPQGVLILVEGTGEQRLLDLTFALTKGWWKFTDTDLRSDSPLLSANAWQDLFRDVGFSGSLVAGCSGAGPDVSRQSVLLAQSPNVTFSHPAAGQEPEVGSVESGSWLILADRTGVGDELALMLRDRGAEVTLASAGEKYEEQTNNLYCIRPLHPEDYRTVLYSRQDGCPLKGVVHLWNLDLPSDDELDSAALQEALSQSCGSVRALLQALGGPQSTVTPRLWLVSRRGQPVEPGDNSVQPLQAPLLGLGKVIAFEHPELRCKNIDLDGRTGAEAALTLLEELTRDDGEERIAVRGDVRYVQRLGRASLTRRTAFADPSVDSPNNFHIRIESPGSLEGLAPVLGERRRPAPHEIEVRVHAAGLNFRDVMKALGALPQGEGEAMWGWLGDECAGTIVAIGRDVEKFSVGDAVMAIAPACFGRYSTTPAFLAAAKPEHLTFEEAAGLPIAYVTALFALRHVGKLQPGESALIHAGAGGVGVAAIHVARWLGAEVFATAGSPAKREFLRALGVPHVMDSRSLGFADEILDVTQGRGVDAVLNSLAGEALQKSVACLAPFGRFLEIGRRDIYQNCSLSMEPFSKCISFTSVDLGRVTREKPDLMATVVREVAERVADRSFPPLPVRTFAIAEADAAFRYMAHARHTGKLVLSLRDSPDETAALEEIELRHDATYLITGGLGGFGLEVALWLADRGARHVALMSRRDDPGEKARHTLEELRAQGVSARILRGDVACESDVARVLQTISEMMPPLRGVIHAAMVLEDGPLATLTQEAFDRVMAPKAVGAWNLHRATQACLLDFFVLFSSGSSLAGSPAQGNYVAGNAYIDALAHFRRAQGLPAMAINWGRIAETGYVAEHAEIGARLSRLGLEGVRIEEAFTLLGRLLVQNPIQIGVVRADWRKLEAIYPGASRFSLLTRFAADTQAESDVRSRPTAAALAKIAPAEREVALQQYVAESLGRVLQIDPARLNPNLALDTLGLDSMTGMELIGLLEAELGVTLPVGALSHANTVSRLAREIHRMMGGSAAQFTQSPAILEPALAEDTEE